jgi:predicted GNAT family acetyltransferase
MMTAMAEPKIATSGGAGTTRASDPHSLDHVIWHALTTRQKELAQGSALAWRFHPEVAPFGAMGDTSPASFAALKKLIPSGGRVALFTAEPVVPPSGFEILNAKTLDQMVGSSKVSEAGSVEMMPLGVADVAEMMALVELTKPGPFAARTREMGPYLGIRQGGRLLAMAGERLKIPGFTEISAVCVHPEYRGRGYARALMGAVADLIAGRGEKPFLHVASENESAIALYKKLGFVLRRTMNLTVLGI